jgi:hypothetical protein
MFLIKEFLLKNNKIVVIGSTNSADNCAKACQTLVRFGYVTYSDIKTSTEIENNRRFTSIKITLTKTKDFERLYKENEEAKKKMEKKKKKKKKINFSS